MFVHQLRERLLRFRIRLGVLDIVLVKLGLADDVSFAVQLVEGLLRLVDSFLNLRR